MKILFLDQTGELGGAELSLLDITKFYTDCSLVALFSDGPFRTLLEQHRILVQIFADHSIQVRKESGLIQGLSSIGQLIPLINQVTQLSRSFDLVYANTPKALVVGAIASFFSHRPLVYHLRDILSPKHFSQTNRHLIVILANRFAARVIANSEASQTAFIEAGGRPDLTEVIYNGFEPNHYGDQAADRPLLRQQLNLENRFVVGHFSRLSPWKGQHVLIQALAHCPDDVTAILVGDALFGETDYAIQLHRQVVELNLQDRVQFLGFRSDIPALMTACDLIAHTSIAPEPFGRVIVEAMLCNRPVVAAKAGGAIELITHGETGWLTCPGDVLQLAALINQCRQQPELTLEIAKQAQIQAIERFNLTKTQQQIDRLLNQVLI
jgi:glycosyltransferase involved in cell wall biosynthesis